LHNGAELGFPAILFLALFFGTISFFMIKEAKMEHHHSVFEFHQRLILLIVLPIYLLILIFGVHTLAYEFNAAFSILIGVMVSYDSFLSDEKIENPKIKDLKYITIAIIIIIAAFYAWRIKKNNNSSLNSERRQAAYGINVEKGFEKWEHWKGIPFRHRWIKDVAHATFDRKN